MTSVSPAPWSPRPAGWRPRSLMRDAARPAQSEQGQEPRFQQAVVLTSLCVVAATSLARISIGRNTPFWLDEAFTGAISADADLRTLLHDILNDANAPLYYLLSWGWARVFGISDGALRALAALCGLLTPLVVLRAPLDRTTRWTWCAMLACWVQGLVYSQDARCYTMAELLSAAGTVAFLRLLQSPSTGRAAWWCGWWLLAILTHYDAAFNALTQGAAYLAVHRRAALRTWPAALVLLPLAGWLAIHGERAMLYGRRDVAWHPLLNRHMVWNSVTFVFGRPKPMLAIAAAMAAAAPRALTPAPERRAPWLAFWAACAAAVLMLLIGAQRPFFIERYLASCAPGLLLGPVLVCTDPRRWFGPAPLALIAAALLAAFTWARRDETPYEHYYSWERASGWVAQARPREVVFLWDHPATKIQAPDSLARVGGFFLNRAHAGVEVHPLQPAPNTDPNPAFAAAAARPGVATIWIYDLNVAATAARRWPPRALAGHQCANFGHQAIGIVACRPRP